MNQPLTQKAIDHSDTEKFAFSFFCDICGKEWKSPVIKFKAGGFTSIKNGEAYQLIWAQEHRTAFEQANLEAHWHFNHCPKCGKWVCVDCFDDGNGEFCKECCIESVAKNAATKIYN